MEEWIDAAATAGAEVVQWDELHLALSYRAGSLPWACRCAACQEAFRTRFAMEMPTTATTEVQVFLDDLISETLTWLVDTARDRGLQSSIVFLANEGYDPELWRTAASLPGVGYLGTTAFWLFYGIPRAEMDAYLALWATRMLAATAGTRAEPLGWVQAFDVPLGRESEIEQAVAALDSAGVSTIAVWSYLACVAMSGLAPDEPDAAWAAVNRAFARVATQD
jgi:hypothetical protein